MCFLLIKRATSGNFIAGRFPQPRSRNSPGQRAVGRVLGKDPDEELGACARDKCERETTRSESLGQPHRVLPLDTPHALSSIFLFLLVSFSFTYFSSFSVSLLSPFPPLLPLSSALMWREVNLGKGS